MTLKQQHQRIRYYAGIILLVIASSVHLRRAPPSEGEKIPARTLPPIQPEEYRQNLLKYVFAKVQGYKDGIYECKGNTNIY